MFSKKLMLEGIDIKIKTRQDQIDAINSRQVSELIIDSLVNKTMFLGEIKTLKLLKYEIENFGYDE